MIEINSVIAATLRRVAALDSKQQKLDDAQKKLHTGFVQLTAE